MEKIVIFGAGGHAMSVVDILLSSGDCKVLCMVTNEEPEGDIAGIPVVFENHYLVQSCTSAVVAIGDNKIRKKLSVKLEQKGFRLVNAVSPHSYVSDLAVLGVGVVVMPFSVVGPGTTIGDGSIINTRAGVDHDCIIGSYTHIAPGSTICGFVVIGDCSFICAGATVIDKIKIGSYCTVGAGAVVIRSLTDNKTVVGVPAKEIRRT